MSAPDADAGSAHLVLVYSSDPEVRERVRMSLGRRPAKGLTLDYVEASTGQEVIDECERGGVELAILDGEAAPAGGMGLCRQLKEELLVAPLVLILVGRRDDAWLATWSEAEGVVPHPIDAVQITEAVTDLLLGVQRQPARPA